jgi:hypothetical protein
MIQRELIFACSGEVSHGWDEIKLGSWRALGGALVLVAYGGFNFAGWYTGGAAAKAKEIAQMRSASAWERSVSHSLTTTRIRAQKSKK